MRTYVRKPCIHCGGPKGPGAARRICETCTAAGIVRCPACGTWKERGDFFPAPSRSTGLTAYCKTCAVDRNRDQRYGLPIGGFRALRDEQDGRCAVCADLVPDDAWHIDHDHATGAVRALLCRGCNHALGNLRDDPNRALAAAAYLLRHQGGEPHQPR